MLSRGAFRLASSRTRRGIALSWSVLFILSLLLQYATFALAPAALAVHSDGTFELDGNATASATPGDDWNSLGNADTSTFIHEAPDSTIFTTGGSKDDLNTTSWRWTNGSVPDKDDLLDGFAAVYDNVIYFGADRFANNGDSAIGFWFFQNGLNVEGGGTFSPAHKVGDLFVVSHFENGGATSEIQLFTWVGSGGSDGALDLTATGQICTTAPAADKACGIANATAVDAPWSYTPKAGTPGTFPQFSFFEGGLDLAKVFPGTVPCFGSFLVETRSSQEVNAQLKDFIAGDFNTCVPPTITTDASVSTFHFGNAAVTDTATLSGTDGPASGKVKFFVCDPTEITGAGCPAGTGTQVGAAAGVTVTTTANGGTATSVGFTPTAAGKYCFRAEYTPDAASQYLAATHTNATTECFTVVKNDTSIATAAEQTVSVGTAIADSATLSGATADAGGNIVFRAYGPGDATCSNTAAFVSASFPVNGNGTYGPASFTPSTAGTYRWIASYSGDAHNQSSIGQCNDAGENDTVNKGNPSIATVASADVEIGGSLSDTATVSGGHNPTGTVTFKLFGPDNATCAGAPIATSTVALSGVTATSASVTPTAVGTYRWIATYNGDVNNNAVSGACGDENEQSDVNPAHPSITTELVSGEQSGAAISIALGASAHDTSTLTDATADAGGTVHYQVFTDATCETKFADAGTKTVTNHLVPNSDDVQFALAGKYYWSADYSGDAKNDSASSNCSLEIVSVGQNTPTITTNASGSVVIGGQIHDTATLAAGFNPTGTITFRLYGPNDATCATIIFTSTINANGNGDYVSAAFTANTAGTYRWIARYSGDDNNAAVAGKCNDEGESVLVTTPNLHTVKLVATGNSAFAGTSIAKPGDVLNYQITVSNTGNGAATNVPVSDNISALLAHGTYNADCSNGCNFAASTLTWTIPTIAAGGHVTLTFSVTLNNTFPTGTTELPNVVVVLGPGSNCAAGSTNEDCDTDTTVATSLLTIEKGLTGNTGGTDPDLEVPAANVGDTLHYTLTYQGRGLLTTAVITDVLPAGLEYVDGSAAGDTHFTFVDYNSTTRTLTWKSAALLTPDPKTNVPASVDGAVTYNVKVLATAPGFSQPLVNVATIDSDQTEPDGATASVAVLEPPLGVTTTPPPTDTFTPQTGTSNPGFALMLLLLGVAAITLAIGFVTPAPARVARRRDRQG